MDDIKRKPQHNINLKPKKPKKNRQDFSPGFFHFIDKNTQKIKKSLKKNSKKEKKSEKKKKKNRPKKKKSTITWTARQYIKKRRGPNWYLYIGVIAAALILFAAVTKDPILGIVFILITVVIFLQADQEPNKLKIKLGKKGIYLDKKLYPYNDIKSFWIFYNPPGTKILSIVTNKVYLPALSIQLEDQNPVLIRRFLLKYIDEEEQEETVIDVLAERLKL